VAVACFVQPNGQVICVKNTIAGYLTEKVRLDYPPGLPYRAYFIERQSGKYLMDLNSAEWVAIDHRRQNIADLYQYLTQ